MHDHEAEPRFFDVPELAKRWRCSEQIVRRNRAKWGLAGLQFGKRLLFSEDEVIAVEQRMREQPRTAA